LPRVQIPSPAYIPLKKNFLSKSLLDKNIYLQVMEKVESFLMKTAIIYYSRTENTKNAAETLQNKLREKNIDVELIRIKPEKRPGFFKASKIAIKQEELPIENSNYDLSEYEKIIIGVPSWANHPAPFYKTFLNKSNGFKNKQFAIFITGSRSISSNESTIDSMKNELNKLDIKQIEAELILKMIKGKIVDGEKNIDTFVDKIGG
jgi:flavodoxin